MIGIYKITCLKNKRVYIGQSIDIEKRIDSYKRLSNCKTQAKLFNSLKKYGVDNHKFEVITECDHSELNKWERYYQDMFSAIGKNGLNLVLTDSGSRPIKFSEETLMKMSEVKKGKKFTQEHKSKIGIANSGKKRTVEQIDKTRNTKYKDGYNPFFSEEARKKISDTHKGHKYNVGRKASIETKMKLSASLKLRVRYGKPVVNMETGIFFDSVAEAARCHGLTESNLRAMITGYYKNKTNLIFA